jgi:hypothetical protein
MWWNASYMLEFRFSQRWSVEVCQQTFRRMHCLHPQGWTVSQANNHQEAGACRLYPWNSDELYWTTSHKTVSSHSLYLLYLTTLSIAQVTLHQMAQWFVNWKKHGKVWLWTNLHYPGICMEELRNTMKTSGRMAGLQDKIWTRDLLGTKKGCYLLDHNIQSINTIYKKGLKWRLKYCAVH